MLNLIEHEPAEEQAKQSLRELFDEGVVLDPDIFSQ